MESRDYYAMFCAFTWEDYEMWRTFNRVDSKPADNYKNNYYNVFKTK